VVVHSSAHDKRRQKRIEREIQKSEVTWNILNKNKMFLKKPERIEVLGAILLMALLVWNLIDMPCANMCLKMTWNFLAGTTKKHADPPHS